MLLDLSGGSEMSVMSASHTYVVPDPLEQALRSIRGALDKMELDVVGEIELSEHVKQASERRMTGSRILLVGCPILDLEAVALGRAAAVFVPLHVLVSAERNETRVSVVNPTGLFDARFPIGARGPIDKLVARFAMAMDSIAPAGNHAM